MGKPLIIDESTSTDPVAPRAFSPPAPPAPPTPPLEPKKQEITAAGLKKAVELVGKQPKEVKNRPSAVPVKDVTVILGMQNREGHREEVIHDINSEEGLRIVTCTHSIEEKTRAVKEDGQLVGYEPTGEYILTLKIKYIKD